MANGKVLASVRGRPGSPDVPAHKALSQQGLPARERMLQRTDLIVSRRYVGVLTLDDGSEVRGDVLAQRLLVGFDGVIFPLLGYVNDAIRARTRQCILERHPSTVRGRKHRS
jgi:hypothetical protein